MGIALLPACGRPARVRVLWEFRVELLADLHYLIAGEAAAGSISPTIESMWACPCRTPFRSEVDAHLDDLASGGPKIVPLENGFWAIPVHRFP